MKMIHFRSVKKMCFLQKKGGIKGYPVLTMYLCVTLGDFIEYSKQYNKV